MACVNVPKDLSKVKSKAQLNLTKRRLICFGGAAYRFLKVGGKAKQRMVSGV